MRAVAAGITVVLSVASGFLVNLLTQQWTWALAAALLVIVLAWIAVAVMEAEHGPGESRVRQRASRGGKIIRSPINARRPGAVKVTADRDGEIRDSGIDLSP